MSEAGTANEAAEQTLLGAILVNPAVLDTVLDIVRPEHFSRPLYGRAFAACCALATAAEPIGLVTVRAELERQGESLDPETVSDLARLVDGMPRFEAATHWARMVLESARRRALVLLGQRLADKAVREDEGTDELIDRHQAALMRLLQAGDGRHLSSLTEILPQAMADLDAFLASKDGITGIPSGIGDLDRLLGGWQRGTLNVVAARPRRGKSVLCAQAARNAAGAGFKVLAFTLEMPPRAVVQRMLMAEGRVDRFALRSSQAMEAWQRIGWAVEKLRGLPVWFDDREAPTLAQIISAARRLKALEGLDLLIVDYIQRCSVDRKQDRWVAVGELVKGLKGLAMNLGIAVLCAAQLNRQGEHDKPNLGQLREAGDIEQEADVIAFLHPHESPGTSADKVLELDFPPVDLWIEKHRNGPGAVIDLTLERRFTRFAPRQRDQ